MVSVPADRGPLPAFLARPSTDERRPAVIAIHEIFGLNDHTKDVARRIAREGYVAMAPNLFGSEDLAAVLTPHNVQRARQFMVKLARRDPVLAEEELAKLPEAERDTVAPTVRYLMGGLPKDRLAKDLVAAVGYLRAHPSVAGDRIGSVGFCFGGAMSLLLACDADIAGCVAFYGENPAPIDRVRGIRGPVLALYGGEDPRINAGLPELVRAVVEHKKDFEMRIYPGAPHAFFNDTNPGTYREGAARDAWDRVLRLFRRTLVP